jgi:hypothetical protein
MDAEISGQGKKQAGGERGLRFSALRAVRPHRPIYLREVRELM